MTLMELLTTMDTQGHIPASRVKDIKTSLGYLAHALGHATMDQCQEAPSSIASSLWQQKLDTHFSLLVEQEKSSPPIPFATPVPICASFFVRPRLKVCFHLLPVFLNFPLLVMPTEKSLAPHHPSITYMPATPARSIDFLSISGPLTSKLPGIPIVLLGNSRSASPPSIRMLTTSHPISAFLSLSKD